MSPPIRTRRGLAIAERAGYTFVKEMLRVMDFKKRTLTEDKQWRELGLRRQLGDEVFSRFNELVKRKEERAFMKTRKRQIEKLERLRKEAESKFGDRMKAVPDSERWVVNLSKHELSESEKKVLMKGLNFAPVCKRVPKVDYIASVEPALRKLEDVEAANIARAKISAMLKSAKCPPSNLTREDEETWRGLEKREEIVIAPADKGSAVVVLDTEDYDRRCWTSLRNLPSKR